MKGSLKRATSEMQECKKTVKGLRNLSKAQTKIGYPVQDVELETP